MKKDPPTEIRSLSFYRQTATGGRKKVEPAPEFARWAMGNTWLTLLCGIPEQTDPILRQFSGATFLKQAEWVGFLDGAGTLQNLLAPIAALWILCGEDKFEGKTVSEYWSEKLETIRRARAIIHEDPFLKERKGSKESLEEHLQRYEKDLELRIQRAEAAEKILLSAGCTFDPMTGRATIKTSGRGRDYLRECVWRIYKANYAGEGPTPRVCRMIAKELSPYFDAKELDPENRALFYDTITKGEKRRK